MYLSLEPKAAALALLASVNHRSHSIRIIASRTATAFLITATTQDFFHVESRDNEAPSIANRAMFELDSCSEIEVLEWIHHLQMEVPATKVFT